MDKRLRQTLEGGLGSFWVLSRPRIRELRDEQTRSGFIRRQGGVVELHLLEDDPTLALAASERQPFPAGILGITEHTGTLLLDIVGTSATRIIAGSRASVERFRAQTLLVHPSVLEIDSTLVKSVSAYFLSKALLSWAGLDAVEEEVMADATGRVKAATIRLKPTADLRASLTPSTDLRLSGYWRLGDSEDHRQIVETGLEIEVESGRATKSRDLLLPLLRCQEFLSIAFLGFVRADHGRARCQGTAERGHMWNAMLMPDEAARHIRVAALNEGPSFLLADLDGIEGLARWIRLCRRHQRAVSPIFNHLRRGPISDEVRLLELASAIEYWVASHRRKAGWAHRGANPPEALGHHVGRAFADWVGDIQEWAKVFWSHYNGLKHDPSFTPDPLAVHALQESAYLVLTADLFNRVAGSQTPGRRMFSDYRHNQLKDWIRSLKASQTQ